MKGATSPLGKADMRHLTDLGGRTLSDVKIPIAVSNTQLWRSKTMPRSNPLLWPKPPAIWSYGIGVLLVAAALLISRLPAIHLQDAPVSLFLCSVLLSAWFGGIGPGLLATALSALAFNYYFLPPIHSLGPKPDEIPRLVIFTVSALFVGSDRKSVGRERV